eukprot:scaffold132159_cov21-Prasinocladus_malaysianus.AAC.1
MAEVDLRSFCRVRRYLAVEDGRMQSRAASARSLHYEERAPMVSSRGLETRHQVMAIGHGINSSR